MPATLCLPFLIFESIPSGCVRYWQIHFASKQILSELSQVTFHMERHLYDIYSSWQKQAQTCPRVPLFSLWEDKPQNDTFTKGDSLLHGKLFFMSYILFKIIYVVTKGNSVISLTATINTAISLHIVPMRQFLSFLHAGLRSLFGWERITWSTSERSWQTERYFLRLKEQFPPF